MWRLLLLEIWVILYPFFFSSCTKGYLLYLLNLILIPSTFLYFYYHYPSLSYHSSFQSTDYWKKFLMVFPHLFLVLLRPFFLDNNPNELPGTHFWSCHFPLWQSSVISLRSQEWIKLLEIVYWALRDWSLLLLALFYTSPLPPTPHFVLVLWLYWLLPWRAQRLLWPMAMTHSLCLERWSLLISSTLTHP